MPQKRKNISLRTIKKILLIIGIIFGSLLLIYWLKSMLGWDLSRSHRLSDSFPFNLFQRSRLLVPQQEGIIIDEDFDSLQLENIWFLWTRQPDTVHFKRDIDKGDKTKSLVFFSDTNDEWSYVFTKYIKVKQNDIFRYRGWTKKFKAENLISLRVAAFDITKEPLNWKYKENKAEKAGEWIPLSEEFVIKQPEIAYIKFQLVGKGKGMFRFDNIFFALELRGQ
ncbi:MAG: hypothetical protein OEM02_03665 [Desulfobulbaceae bacterium]|nr:hypothetical protein [Desulfobulbaceae bacterium]